MKTKLSKLLKIFLSLVLLLSSGVIIPMKADAAALSSVSDTIEDSRPSPTTSNHTILFTTTTLIDDASSHTVTVTFPAGFTMTSITEDDVDILDDTVQKTTAATCAGTEHFSAAVSGQVLTFTACTGDGGDIAGGSIVEIRIGNHAAGSGTGTNKITNHATPAVYDITLGGTYGDTGTAKIAVIATITASATVSSTLSLTITGRTPAQCADYDNTAGTEITTTAATVPFGTVNTEAFYDGCQRLDIGTNAAGGYTISAKESDQLTSAGTPIPDGACDGGCSETAEADWATATFNGLGYCMQDITGNGAATADAGWGTNNCDAADTFFKIFAELNVDTPEQQTIMSSAGPVNDISDVGYRLSVDSLQAAGSYTNNIIFVATPTY